MDEYKKVRGVYCGIDTLNIEFYAGVEADLLTRPWATIVRVYGLDGWHLRLIGKEMLRMADELEKRDSDPEGE